MKKTVSFLLSLIILLGIVFYIFVYPKFEIVSGFNAKVLCSCTFLSGIDQERAEKEELGFSLLWLASNTIDEMDKTVTSSVFGMHQKTAVYREGFGCALVNDLDVDEIKEQQRGLTDQNYTADIWPDREVVGTEAIQNALRKAFDKEGEEKLITRAVVVLKDGQLIGEAYADGVGRKTPLLGWSMAKTITGFMAGILVGDGHWELDSSLPIEEWANDERSDITLKNAMQMSTGLAWEEDYGKVSFATKMLYGSDDMGAYAQSLSLAYHPGEHWEYSSGTSNILARTMENFFADESDYHSFPFRRLFEPIGAESFVLETDASGHFVGSSYGYGSARDWAKLGLLALNKGNWQGTQIIDSTWVTFMTEVPAKDSDGQYGGQTWLNRNGKFSNYSEQAYWMGGFQGQQVSVHPDKNMVIVRLGVTNTRGDFDFDAFAKEVFEAVEPPVN
ncbi:MAG TPA: serine hydrolase [Cryomorphaceae bacterium]|nr:serine hydrolase [Cryomorphaceae bacterium]